MVLIRLKYGGQSPTYRRGSGGEVPSLGYVQVFIDCPHPKPQDPNVASRLDCRWFLRSLVLPRFPMFPSRL